jgi:L-galactose dehydrogenase
MSEPAVGQMPYRALGRTGLEVSIVGYGASPLGGVYGEIDEAQGIRAVHRALDLGVNIIDVSPYYGLTRAETVLGRALRGVDRSSYVLATKVGRYDVASFDFSPARVRASVAESLARLGTDHIDLIQCHDIEFGDLDQIAEETIPALRALQQAGTVRFVGITGYPLGALAYLARRADVDTVLSYCRSTLLDHALSDWAPAFRRLDVGLMSASPLAMGALTARGAPPWHPAPPGLLALCEQAAELCARQGSDLARIAMQHSLSIPDAATTFVGSAKPENMERSVRWALEPVDEALRRDVEAVLAPAVGTTWASGRPENLLEPDHGPPERPG